MHHLLYPKMMVLLGDDGGGGSGLFGPVMLSTLNPWFYTAGAETYQPSENRIPWLSSGSLIYVNDHCLGEDGSFVVGIYRGASNLTSFMFYTLNFETGSWSSVASPYAPTHDAYGPFYTAIACSPKIDGNSYIAVALAYAPLAPVVGPKLIVLKWDGTSLTLLAEPVDSIVGDPHQYMAWDGQGTRLCASESTDPGGVGNLDRIVVWDFIAEELVNKRVAAPTEGAYTLAWPPDWQPQVGASYFAGRSHNGELFVMRDDGDELIRVGMYDSIDVREVFWDASSGYILGYGFNPEYTHRAFHIFQFQGEVPGLESLDYEHMDPLLFIDGVGSPTIHASRRLIALHDAYNIRFASWGISLPPVLELDAYQPPISTSQVYMPKFPTHPVPPV